MNLASGRRVLMHLWISSVIRDWFQSVHVGAPHIFAGESEGGRAKSNLGLKWFGGAVDDLAVMGVGPGAGETWALL